MLQEEIALAKLSAEQLACFYHLLVDVVSDNGRPNTMESQYIKHLFPNLEDVQERSEVDALWKYSEIVLKAAVTVSVLGGRYPVEQARRISRLAQQFGFSAKRLRILEDQALKAIQFRGKQINMDLSRTVTETLKRQPNGQLQTTEELSYSDFMQGLWQSDADLIQHTQNTSVDWDSEEDS